MLNCIYHPFEDMKVVDNEEYEKCLASGEWFDHPQKALDFRNELLKPKDEKPKKLAKSKMGEK